MVSRRDRVVGVVEEREEIFPYSNVKIESSLAVHILLGFYFHCHGM